MRLRPASVLAGLLATVVVLQPGSSAACGGTFCDSGPQAMPVDQTGENVLFVLDGQYVEAHVQIQYTPGASRFAWIVPMPKVPEVSIGSAPLFATLTQGSVPTFGNSRTFDACGSTGCYAGGGSGGSSGTGGSGGGLTMDAGADGAAGGPSVVLRETVGAFEVVVLQGGTAQEVSDWLTANSYATTASTPALLADYVAKSFVFVAVKLTARADLSEIHPLVFRYQGTEPCIPLKLTAVAAAQDMGVRAFFLGDHRVFPTNYKHVVVSPLRFDWGNNASNYKAVVSRAVDSAVADGHAFVTEYAGPTQPVTSPVGVYSSNWNAAPFVTADPTNVVQLLNTQALTYCDVYQCVMNHPLLLGLLHEYLPVPSGTDDATYYSGLESSGADAAAFPAWDGAAFAAALDDRIIKPGKHAADLLAAWPYLTRLYTTISGPEMTLDPEFVARPEYDTQSVRLGGVSTQRTACNGASGFKLPGVWYDVGANQSAVYPVFSSAMPYAMRIEEYAATGAPVVLVDNKNNIEQQLTQWNVSVGWPPPPWTPPPPPTNCYGGYGGSSGSGALSAVGGFAGFQTGDAGIGLSTGGVGGTAGTEKLEARGGCSTAGNAGTGSVVAGFALLGAIGRLRRTRRR